MSMLFTEIERAIVDSASKLPEIIQPYGKLRLDIALCWGALTEPVDAMLTNIGDLKSARLVGALEDGLHVAMFCIGQILRQTPPEASGNKDQATARCIGASHILEYIARQPLSTAVAIEDGVGFRSGTFLNPRYNLSIYGTSVNLPGSLRLDTGKRAKGCPFRKSLVNIYPSIAENVVRAILT